MNERPVGKTRDAGWQIGVSRTVDAELEDVWALLLSRSGLAIWLGDDVATPVEVGQEYRTADGVRGEIRSLRPLDRIRLTWRPADRPDHATVQIALTEAASGCTIRFHTERLVDGDERERMRTHWKTVAGQIEAALADRR